MKPFASLDQVLNSRALTPPAARDVGAAAVGDFQPLFAAGVLGAASAESREESRHDSPQIEMIEADGQVRQIIVTCRCGERTVLDCAY